MAYQTLSYSRDDRVAIVSRCEDRLEVIAAALLLDVLQRGHGRHEVPAAGQVVEHLEEAYGLPLALGPEDGGHAPDRRVGRLEGRLQGGGRRDRVVHGVRRCVRGRHRAIACGGPLQRLDDGVGARAAACRNGFDG